MDLPDDPEALELLDGYLEKLQAGERPDRGALIRRRPDLAAAIEMIEKLEGFAPGSSAAGYQVVPQRPSHFDPTLDVWPEPDVLPRAFGQYELLSEIGRGGMGVVYKARQQRLDRIVAVKMILGQHLASAEHVRRFQAEAQAAARLRHPNIVQIHEVGQLHGQHYFAMEYIEGESLAQRLAPRAARSARGRAAGGRRRPGGRAPAPAGHRPPRPEAVEHPARRRGAAVRDRLRPGQDVRAGHRGDGHGRDRRHAQLHGPRAGRRPATEIGPAADVYSLGAILYELLTGRPPFRADNPLDTLMDVLGGEPVLPRRSIRRCRAGWN